MAELKRHMDVLERVSETSPRPLMHGLKCLKP